MILKLWLPFEGTILCVQNPVIETSVTNTSPSQDSNHFGRSRPAFSVKPFVLTSFEAIFLHLNVYDSHNSNICIREYWGLSRKVVAALQERAVQRSGQKHGLHRGPHPAGSEFQIKVIQVATLLGRTTTHKNSFTNASFQYHIAEDGAAFPKDDTREYLKSSWNKADIQPANKPSARAVRLRILQKVDSICHNSSLLKNARDLSTMWK